MVKGFLAAVAVACCAGCTVNKDLMFRTDEGFAFADLATISQEEYRIAPNDLLAFQLYSNGGQRLLAGTAGTLEPGGNQGVLAQQTANFRAGIPYLVLPDGQVELPEIGNLPLAGKTLEEAEQAVEAAYAHLYHDPFAVLQVTNNRVLVFPGAAGAATVITLTAPNTTVLEVLALAGGVAARGNASQVKLIRRTATGHQVYRMDLSTAAGLSAASTVVQANDVLYVDPVPDVASEVLRDINPIVSIVSSLSVLWALLTNAL